LFSEKYIKISEVDSTNNYALSLKSNPIFKHGLVITADYQTAGLGQRGSSWESEKGENLLLSLVIEPNISLVNKYDISRFICISICDYLRSIGLNPKIKWPNDILVGKDKIAGILIHNLISKSNINYSIVGIGLNVNQIIFSKDLPKAVSIRNKLGIKLDLQNVRVNLLDFCEHNFFMLNNRAELQTKYLEYLFMKNKLALLEKDNQRFNGIIKGVTLDGLLIVQTTKRIRKFDLKEIKIIF
tara:strand:- start:11122 stop:11847 length:726 start_codon:yes stop_codon:yes gene_type:complete